MEINGIINTLNHRRSLGIKSFAVLIDPDKVTDMGGVPQLVRQCVESNVDFIFVGGSLITTTNIANLIYTIKSHCSIPVVLFPGSNMHLEGSADALLFLSLISGRNAEFLIGQHVVAAPILRKSNLEVMPTGYMLIDSGKPTTVSYISNTTPIPADKPDIAACTAMAGELLGLKLIYMDGGSGALYPVPTKMINMVRKSVELPLIVGGGINSGEKAKQALEAGADLIVIGNGIEKNPELLNGVSEKVLDYNRSLNIH